MLQRASEFRAKGIFTFGYLDACRICAKCFKGAPRVMAVPLLGDLCFIGGVEKHRISSPARKLHSGTSSARRKSFRRGDEETQRFFIDGIRSFCGCGQCNCVWIFYDASVLILSHCIFAASERACMNISGGSSPSSAKMQRSA